MSTELEQVDSQSIDSAAPVEQAWARLAARRPTRGYEVLEEAPPRRLVLAGEHPFSRYTLTFELEARPEGASRLSVVTHANFPGVPGRVYRRLVIRTGLHARVMRTMLRGLV